MCVLGYVFVACVPRHVYVLTARVRVLVVRVLPELVLLIVWIRVLIGVLAVEIPKNIRVLTALVHVLVVCVCFVLGGGLLVLVYVLVVQVHFVLGDEFSGCVLLEVWAVWIVGYFREAACPADVGYS